METTRLGQDDMKDHHQQQQAAACSASSGELNLKYLSKLIVPPLGFSSNLNTHNDSNARIISPMDSRYSTTSQPQPQPQYAVGVVPCASIMVQLYCKNNPYNT
ncbi:hypothetical protein OROHE_018812 [Orobanche hederae]